MFGAFVHLPLKAAAAMMTMTSKNQMINIELLKMRRIALFSHSASRCSSAAVPLLEPQQLQLQLHRRQPQQQLRFKQELL